jgi:hypothetical protein
LIMSVDIHKRNRVCGDKSGVDIGDVVECIHDSYRPYCEVEHFNF